MGNAVFIQKIYVRRAGGAKCLGHGLRFVVKVNKGIFFLFGAFFHVVKTVLRRYVFIVGIDRQVKEGIKRLFSCAF